ncbi:hypothetical protein AZ78_5134 [Lysobacter capsici AZ78]|uniref:Uncharacterized protein n=1 Tax=Lysobacter capsici AZ78 TaxID=1444315 RepID=A0A125TZB7_9GAMM|nr:hypothetical protein AZ78_5134 [Lysobacter capsici AZ78]
MPTSRTAVAVAARILAATVSRRMRAMATGRNRDRAGTGREGFAFAAALG